MNKNKELNEIKNAMEVKTAIVEDIPMLEEGDSVFIVDIETGGLNADRNAVLDIHFRSLKSDYKKTFRLRPCGIVEHEALCVNKLHWYDLLKRPKLSRKDTKEIQDLLTDNILIGHNIDFDLKFLQKWFFVNAYAICTQRLARSAHPALPAYSLKYLSQKLLKEYDPMKAHTASYDCYLTERLFKMLALEIKDLKWLVEELKL